MLEASDKRWQDASPIKTFFKQCEYRLDPRDVDGTTRDKKCTSNRQAPGQAMATQRESDGSAIELVDQAIGNICPTIGLERGGSAREVQSGSDVEEKIARPLPASRPSDNYRKPQLGESPPFSVEAPERASRGRGCHTPPPRRISKFNSLIPPKNSLFSLDSRRRRTR
jgi:hypothetical protein